MTTFRAVGVSMTPTAALIQQVVDDAAGRAVAPAAGVTLLATVTFLEIRTAPAPSERVLSTQQFSVTDLADLTAQVTAVLADLKARHEAALRQINLDIARKTIAEVETV